MKRLLAIFAAALGGIVLGSVVMFSLPSPGVQLEDDDAAPTPSPALEKVKITTLLAWTPSELPPGIALTAKNLPGVEAVVEVKSGMAWLHSWSPSGKAFSGSTSGFAIPIEVAAVDPRDYFAFIPPADRAAFAQLSDGNSLIGRTGADFREIEEEGTLQFGEQRIVVEGVVEDELIGAHELVVSSATGAKLGISRARYLLVSIAGDHSREEVEAGLQSLLPSGVRMRIRGPGETPVFRHGDAVLPPLHLKKDFGEFSARIGTRNALEIDPQWVGANVASASIPILGNVSCHKGIFPQLEGAFGEIARRGLGGLIRTDDFGGCFSPRFLSSDPSAGISHHSWGVAFDINVTENPFGAESRLDSRLVEILERWGFTWGGRWLVPDGMHFEFQRWP